MMSTIFEAMEETEREAEKTNKSCYLYKGFGGFGWGISKQRWGDWLFQVYPGGRKILSSAGQKLVDEAKIMELIEQNEVEQS